MVTHVLPLLILNDINVTQGHFGQCGGQGCCHVKISIHQEASERRSGSREVVIIEILATPYGQEDTPGNCFYLSSSFFEGLEELRALCVT